MIEIDLRTDEYKNPKKSRLRKWASSVAQALFYEDGEFSKSKAGSFLACITCFALASYGAYTKYTEDAALEEKERIEKREEMRKRMRDHIMADFRKQLKDLEKREKALKKQQRKLAQRERRLKLREEEMNEIDQPQGGAEASAETPESSPTPTPTPAKAVETFVKDVVEEVEQQKAKDIDGISINKAQLHTLLVMRKANEYRVAIPERLEELTNMKDEELSAHLEELKKLSDELSKNALAEKKRQIEQLKQTFIPAIETEISERTAHLNETDKHSRQWEAWKASSPEKQAKKEKQLSMLKFRGAQLKGLISDLDEYKKFALERISLIEKKDEFQVSRRELRDGIGIALDFNKQKSGTEVDEKLKGEQEYMFEYRKKCWERVLEKLHPKKQ